MLEDGIIIIIIINQYKNSRVKKIEQYKKIDLIGKKTKEWWNCKKNKLPKPSKKNLKNRNQIWYMKISIADEIEKNS